MNPIHSLRQAKESVRQGSPDLVEAPIPSETGGFTTNVINTHLLFLSLSTGLCHLR